VKCQLVICNLPAPGRSSKNADLESLEYISYLEAMTEGIPKMLLVKGTGFEVVTEYY
jgi:hypothetical protein